MISIETMITVLIVLTSSAMLAGIVALLAMAYHERAER